MLKVWEGKGQVTDLKKKIAVLSNINMSFMLRMLKEKFDVYEAEGYGNELGLLLNPDSSYHAFDADFTFFIMDVLEVLEHDLTGDVTEENPYIERWFSQFESAIKPQKIYYVSDACLWGAETEALSEPWKKQVLEAAWLKRLCKTCESYGNVRIFPYRQIVEALGTENSFSLKMWYMGKILHTNEAQKRISEKIEEITGMYAGTPKKVLVLDLDNTLWGGIAGEHDVTPVTLSDDHAGLAYKNLQRVIKLMLESGVLLTIVSKNNEADAMAIIREHPHMVLREECFAAKRINWNNKHENILELAAELNLGTDSFVFFDDNPTEQELVRRMLPEVIVPEFPKRPEELARVMTDIYRTYFAKPVLTREDKEKTEQYAKNAKRNLLQNTVADFGEYLKQLQIVIRPVEAEEHTERLVQLVNKTNQFNLTTRRYTQEEMAEVLQDEKKKVFLYQVTDSFGDYGIVSAAIVDCEPKIPVLEEFVMSCRIMGKKIENAIIEQIEKAMENMGCCELKTLYIPTAKNKPVEKLFDGMGYRVISEAEDGSKEYSIMLKEVPAREYYADIMQ